MLFAHSMFNLINVIPTLGLYYQQASEAYEQACTRYVNTVINYVSPLLILLKTMIDFFRLLVLALVCLHQVCPSTAS